MHVEKHGRRHYIRDLPFDQRHLARDEGCKWDPDRKMWWSGKADAAQAVVDAAGSGSSQNVPAENTGRQLEVIGRAEHKGRGYLLVWEGTTKHGPACKLAFRDGSKTFWSNEAKVTKRFKRSMTVGALLDYAEEQKSERNGTGRRYEGHHSHRDGRRYECDECGEWVTSGDGSTCWETGMDH